MTLWSSNSTPRSITKNKLVHVHQKSCIRIFLAALLLMVKNLKQSKCQSIGEWHNGFAEGSKNNVDISNVNNHDTWYKRAGFKVKNSIGVGSNNEHYR